MTVSSAHDIPLKTFPVCPMCMKSSDVLLPTLLSTSAVLMSFVGKARPAVSCARSPLAPCTPRSLKKEHHLYHPKLLSKSLAHALTATRYSNISLNTSTVPVKDHALTRLGRRQPQPLPQCRAKENTTRNAGERSGRRTKSRTAVFPSSWVLLRKGFVHGEGCKCCQNVGIAVCTRGLVL